MPQAQLPVFPAGTTQINEVLACECRDERVVYFNGHLPVFTHAQGDVASFRLYATQLIVNGTATQAEIQRAFGLAPISTKRWVKRYQQAGAAAFFAPQPRREGSKLTNTVLAQARELLTQGQTVAAISQQTGVLRDTLRKAIQVGRLPKPIKKKPKPR
jgi:transposase-like protein